MKHCKGLDGLRGVAVIMVVVIHCYYQGPQFETAEGFCYEWLRIILSSGWVGVDLFFALSGFLITTIQLEEKEKGYDFRTYIKRFYLKRALRIFPLYYVMLACCLAGSFLVIHPEIDDALGSLRENSWVYVFFVSNHIIPIFGEALPSGNLVGMTWSLSTEEQYYLVWPILLFFIRKRYMMLSLIPLCLLPFFRYHLFREGVASDVIYTSSFTHIDAILSGSLLALLLKFPRLVSFQLPLLSVIGLFGFVLLIVSIVGDQALHYSGIRSSVLGFTGLAMLFGFSVYAIYVHNAFNSILSNRLLVLFGRYSFFIYLFHGFLLHALLSFRVEMNVFGVFGLLVYTLIVLLVSLVLGYASWTLFESKFLKIKEMRVK